MNIHAAIKVPLFSINELQKTFKKCLAFMYTYYSFLLLFLLHFYICIYILRVTEATETETVVGKFDLEMDLNYCILEECAPLNVYGLKKGVVSDLQL